GLERHEAAALVGRPDARVLARRRPGDDDRVVSGAGLPRRLRRGDGPHPARARVTGFMASQDHFWSKAAGAYGAGFIDPYRADLRSPLLRTLRRLAAPARGVVADLGCGIGPLLPLLAELFRTVYAVDFAEGMLERARQRCADLKNVTFLQRGL